MNFIPIQEKQLEHLISSEFTKNVLKLDYIGPVYGHNSKVIDSPDMLLLDKRKTPYKILSCECKLNPSSSSAFKDNGNFDIAIIWEYKGYNFDKFRQELKENNRCTEIIELCKITNYAKLEKYERFDNQMFNSCEIVEKKLFGAKYYTVCAAYIAASIYPTKFSGDKILAYLKSKHPEILLMGAKGRANSYITLLQLELIEKKAEGKYIWNNNYNPVIAKSEILKLLTTKFDKDAPSNEDVNSFR
jgi:hypothetical protein